MARKLHIERLEDRRMLSGYDVEKPIPGYEIGGLGYKVYAGQSQYYGDSLYHAGEDVSANAATNVHSMADGVVKWSGSDEPIRGTSQGYGNLIVIEHTRRDGSKYQSIYGHLSPNGLIPVGSVVVAGQSIGYVGTTAQNGGWEPHLHFQVVEGAYTGLSYAIHGGWLNPSRHAAGWNNLIRPANAIGWWDDGYEAYEGFTSNGWSVQHGLQDLGGDSNVWRLNPDNGQSDPYIHSEENLSLDTATANAIRASIRSSIPGTSSNRDMQLFFRYKTNSGSISDWSEQYSVWATNIPQSQFVEVTFDLRNAGLPTNAELYQLRLDVGRVGYSGSSDLVEIDWITTFDNSSAPTDTTRPTVISTSPTDGATLSSGPSFIDVNFSEPMGTLLPSDLTLSGAGKGSATVSNASWVDSNTARFTIGGTWGNGAVIISLTGTYPRDMAGNSLVSYSGGFTIQTVDTIRPTVTSTSPSNGATLSSGPSSIDVNFSEAMGSSLAPGDLTLSGAGKGSAAVSGANWLDSDTARFTMSGTWGTGTVTVSLSGTYPKDLAGNSLLTYSGGFTIQTVDTIRPTVVSTSPPNGATLSNGPNFIDVSFSEPMGSSLATGDLTLSGAGKGSAIVSSASWLDADTAQFTISGAWGNGAVTIALPGPSPKDLAGNNLVAYSSSFSVAPQQPQIRIADENGAALVDGSSILVFPSDPVGATDERWNYGTFRTLTIYNDGSAPLSIGPIVHPAGFTIIQSPQSPIAAGGSASLVLRMDTENSGAVNQQLQIPNNASPDGWFVFNLSGVVEQTTKQVTYLSQLTPTYIENGWGNYIEIDRSNGEQAPGDGGPITLNGRIYDRGLGVHARSEVAFNLAANYEQFIVDVGVDDEVGGNGSVVFRVQLDGQDFVATEVLTGTSPIRLINIPVSGKNELRLFVTDGGNGNNFDHADWANARLIWSAPPTAPPNVTASDGIYTDGVLVSWDNVAAATSYEIWKNTADNSSTAQRIAQGVTATSYGDRSTVSGLTYYYWVKAVNPGGVSTFSNSDTGWRYLWYPTGVTASDTFSDRVEVQWNFVLDASSYEVWRNTTDIVGSAQLIAPNAPGSTYQDVFVAAGVSYYYWVKAKNDHTSSFSSYDTGLRTVGASPSPPGNVSATDAVYTDAVQVAWDNVNGTTGYEVWRNEFNDSSAAQQLAQNHSGTSFNDFSAIPGQTYFYWIKSIGPGGLSSFSISDSGWRYLFFPTGVTASDNLSDRVEVRWDAVFGATTYEVWRNSFDSNGSAQRIAQNIPALHFDDLSVTPGATYYYWIKANNDHTSTFSDSDAGTIVIQQPLLPGDYNRNTAVDAADYVMWRKTLGVSVPRYSGADGDGNGSVGPNDYSVWRANYGNTFNAASISLAASSPPLRQKALAQLPDATLTAGAPAVARIVTRLPVDFDSNPLKERSTAAVNGDKLRTNYAARPSTRSRERLTAFLQAVDLNNAKNNGEHVVGCSSELGRKAVDQVYDSENELPVVQVDFESFWEDQPSSAALSNQLYDCTISLRY